MFDEVIDKTILFMSPLLTLLFSGTTSCISSTGTSKGRAWKVCSYIIVLHLVDYIITLHDCIALYVWQCVWSTDSVHPSLWIVMYMHVIYMHVNVHGYISSTCVYPVVDVLHLFYIIRYVSITYSLSAENKHESNCKSKKNNKRRRKRSNVSRRKKENREDRNNDGLWILIDWHHQTFHVSWCSCQLSSLHAHVSIVEDAVPLCEEKPHKGSTINLPPVTSSRFICAGNYVLHGVTVYLLLMKITLDTTTITHTKITPKCHYRPPIASFYS